MAQRKDLRVPRRAVSGTDVDEVQLRVVGDPVPHRPPAAVLPPLSRPRLGGHRHRLVLEAVRRVAGHGVPAPDLLPAGRVVGGHVAADRPELRPAVPDDHLVLEDPRGAGDHEREVRVHGHSAPQLGSGAGVDRDQAPVGRRLVDGALPESDPAAVVPQHAHTVAGGLDHLRIVFPEQLAGRRVHGAENVVARLEVEDAFHHQRRAHQRPVLRQIHVPGDSELRDVGFVHLDEGAVPLLAVVASVGEPVVAVTHRR
jgi:hypothetical protein